MCRLWLRIDLIICAFRANMSLPKGKTHIAKNRKEGTYYERKNQNPD
nr:MAG TPA: hypothetical protein [Caudoviricetes sp.]